MHNPDLRTIVARAMAEAAGSKAFREPGREWDHLRSVWYGHADAALGAVQAAYVSPPPGSDRAKLPDHILAVIDAAPYISSYEQIADALEAAIPAHPELADELQLWADRMRDSCRQTRKQDMAPCAHLLHRARPVPALDLDRLADGHAVDHDEDDQL